MIAGPAVPLPGVLSGVPQIVLADANVLYSRVLRDYLLYAAEYRLIAVAWSRSILDEVTEHLMANRPGFTVESAARLVTAMTKAFPYAERNPGAADYQKLAHLSLPDEDDRHVLAAALAAEADIICTSNLADFPEPVVAGLGFSVMTPDELLCRLIAAAPAVMLLVHETSVANLRGATDLSTIDALRRAGASQAAEAVAGLLGV